MQCFNFQILLLKTGYKRIYEIILNFTRNEFRRNSKIMGHKYILANMFIEKPPVLAFPFFPFKITLAALVIQKSRAQLSSFNIAHFCGRVLK